MRSHSLNCLQVVRDRKEEIILTSKGGQEKDVTRQVHPNFIEEINIGAKKPHRLNR
jgi:hypothetical protein